MGVEKDTNPLDTHNTDLAVLLIRCNVPSQFRLPAVTVVQKLGLVVQELLTGLRGVFEVRSFHDRVHRTGLLAEATVDALRHVDVVPCRPTAAVRARFSFDRDRLGRADRFTEFTCDAALLTAVSEHPNSVPRISTNESQSRVSRDNMTKKTKPRKETEEEGKRKGLTSDSVGVRALLGSVETEQTSRRDSSESRWDRIGSARSCSCSTRALRSGHERRIDPELRK